MRDPDESHPEYISDDEAERRYLAGPDFWRDLCDALEDVVLDEVEGGVAMPPALRETLVAWYRSTPRFEGAVLAVRDDAERPWV